MRKIILVVMLFSCVAPAHAQFKASIQGTVMDTNGGVVANARVLLTNQATGATRDTSTSDQGFYRISELPPGRYTVRVEATGFKSSVSKDVEIKAEEPRGLDVALEIGTVNEQVTVSA